MLKTLDLWMGGPRGVISRPGVHRYREWKNMLATNSHLPSATKYVGHIAPKFNQDLLDNHWYIDIYWPRPNRWSLFSRMVSVRPSQKTKTLCNANVVALKTKQQTPCMKIMTTYCLGPGGSLEVSRLVIYFYQTKIEPTITIHWWWCPSVCVLTRNKLMTMPPGLVGYFKFARQVFSYLITRQTWQIIWQI